MTKNTTAHIENEDDTGALWIVIQNNETKTHLPIQADEVELIIDACEDWLERESQKQIKVTTAKHKLDKP